MNYVRHLNAFFALVRSDQRLTSSHVSLYMALFQYWNFNRFHNPFSIYRDNIMQLSKIGSKNTYHKCIKELHEAKYIFYHPSLNKFHLVRISIIPLDVQPELPSRYKQLDLFDMAPALSPLTSPKIDTDSVPKSVQASTDNDTVPVPKSVYIVKPNSIKQKNVCNTHNHFLNTNGKIQEQTGKPIGVPKSVHDTGQPVPQMAEVEEFFSMHTYPPDEAKKFFLYNQGKNWMLNDKLKIKDWQALAHKWMLNIKKSNVGNQTVTTGPAKQSADAELNFLYDSFLEGQKIFQHITTEHFDHLQLKLTDEIMQHAWKQRTEQISGSNQFSLGQLWQAYIKGDIKNPLLIKDTPTLISLAKRMAVIQHFHTLKNKQQ